MGNFKDFIEVSGVSKTDFSRLSKDERLKQGKDIGEKFIIQELFRHGVKIVTVPEKVSLDTKLKIDGYLDGNPNEPVQLKLRRTSRGGDDIAYELVLGYNSRLPISEQLKNPRNQGRDYKGTTVKHYFVLNQDETQIYHIPASKLKSAAMGAIQEAYGRPIDRTSPFRSSLGVELRATTDNSSGVDKLMAFIPAEKVADKAYTIGQGQIQPTYSANHSTMSAKEFNIAAHQARLAKLQAKQKLANDLRKKGYRGNDDQVIAQAGVSVP